MRRGERGKFIGCHPLCQGRIARHPRLGLDVAFGHCHRQRNVGHAQLRTEHGNLRGFVSSSCTEAMIDCRRSDPARHRGMGQQEQGQTVRPARNGKTQCALSRQQPGQVRCKAARQCGGQINRS